MLKYLKNFNIGFIREDLRKIGVNFITAGIVGIFINHFVGTKFSVMFLASLWVTMAGLLCWLLGLFKGVS